MANIDDIPAADQDAAATMSEAIRELHEAVRRLARTIWDVWGTSWYLGWYVRLIDRLRR